MAELGFEPITRSPLYEQVVARLQEFIAGQNLQPGDRLLSERELAERLGVSRTSVRQALTALRVMGLVDIRHGDGIYLQRRPDDLVSTLATEVANAEKHHPMIWEVREAIEVQAARLAARRRTPEDLTSMREALTTMRRSIGDGGAGVDGDRMFHRAIVRASHNELLGQLLGQITDVVDRTSEASLTLPGRAPMSLEAHERILDAIEAEDEQRAAEAMSEHIAVSAERTATDTGRQSPG